jgi:hypothetical protein
MKLCNARMHEKFIISSSSSSALKRDERGKINMKMLLMISTRKMKFKFADERDWIWWWAKAMKEERERERDGRMREVVNLIWNERKIISLFYEELFVYKGRQATFYYCMFSFKLHRQKYFYEFSSMFPIDGVNNQREEI